MHVVGPLDLTKICLHDEGSLGKVFVWGLGRTCHTACILPIIMTVMISNVNPARRVTHAPLFRPYEQQVVMRIVLVCSLMIAWYGVRHCGLPRHCVHVERIRFSPATFQVHLNSATWPELTQMPGIAETLARRIVAHREQHGPFASLDELSQVHGIGPKLLQSMRPYLVPMDEPTPAAEYPLSSPGGTIREIGVES